MGSFKSRGQAWGGFQPASPLNLNFHASRTVETIHFCYLSHSVRDTLLHSPSNGNHRVVLENCIWLSGHLYRQCISVLCLEYLTVLKSKAIRTTLDASETSFLSTVSRAGSSTLWECTSLRKLHPSMVV